MTGNSGIMNLPSVIDANYLLSPPKIERRTNLKISTETPGDEESQVWIDQDRDMQCINCLNRISTESIEVHRSVCSVFVEVNIDSEGALESNQFQASKFIQYLQTLQKDKSLNSNHALLIKKLLRCTEKLKEINEDSSAAFELQQFLNSLSDSQKANNSLRIAIQRLLSIVQTHINILLALNAKERKSKLIEMKKKVNRLRKIRIPRNDRSEIKLDNSKIEQISSQIRSRRASSGHYSISEAPATTTHARTLSQVQMDESQQNFYGICLQIKMQLDVFSPAQTVSIPSLYEMAVRQNICPEDWPRFIHEQLANPSNWKSPPPGNASCLKRFARYPIKNNYNLPK